MSNARALLGEAREAEQRGDTGSAVSLYMQAGEPEEAARLLIANEDYARAGRVLFRAIGLPLERLGEADATQRRLAIKAGACLARAAETGNAVALFTAVGELQRASDLLTRTGDHAGAAQLQARQRPAAPVQQAGVASGIANPQLARSPAPPEAPSVLAARRLEERGAHEAALAQYLQLKSPGDAARVARALGRPAQAGELYEEAGLFYEAGVCFQEARDPHRCLGALVRVAKDHARYRVPCLKAIQLAQQLGDVSFELDQLVSRFLSSGPESSEEAEAFFILGRLYEKLGFSDNAMECYRKITAKDRQHPALARLQHLEAAERSEKQVYERILREDGAFHGEPRTRGGEPLSTTFAVPPELPDLPELPSKRAPGRAQAVQAVQAKPKAQPAATMFEADGAALAAGSAQLKRGAEGVTQLELREGTIIAERYRLEQKLGQGGTAVVYRAADLELEEEVAIKLFTLPVEDPEFVRRFKQELSVARKLSHPNIVRLHDIGAHRGFRFLTMEVLSGADLASLIKNGRLPLATALDYLQQAASGLAVAHGSGVVHRDIKPENFFVTHEGKLKIMDFGIAKKASAQKRTQAGFIAGTPPYMSPEQISGFADVTPLADVYSLGVVAYELVTGVLPFEHAELMPLLVMHMTQEPEPPIMHNSRLPGQLNQLILQLLQKKPEDRVASMAELATRFARLRAALG